MPDTPPPYLYHYTSASGVHAILTSREFWLTGFEGQNDSSEITHGLTKIAETLLALANDDHSADVLPAIQQRLLPFENPARAFAFDPQIMMASSVAVFCLSEEPDDLSQWRAYSQNGEGFALIVDSEQLASLATGRTVLVKCTYEERDIKQLVQPLFDRVAVPVRYGNQGDAIGFQDFWTESVVLAARIKHPAFKAENEWRLVQTNLPLAMMETTMIRGRLRAIVRQPWDIDDLRRRNVVWKVRIGPQENPEIAARSLGPLLSSTCGETSMYEMSKVPYRSR